MTVKVDRIPLGYQLKVRNRVKEKSPKLDTWDHTIYISACSKETAKGLLFGGFPTSSWEMGEIIDRNGQFLLEVDTKGNTSRLYKQASSEIDDDELMFSRYYSKCKQVWNDCYKVQIPTLLDDKHSHPYAMLGMIANMEAVYKLNHFRETGRFPNRKGRYYHQMIRHFFGKAISDDELEIVSEHFINATRHLGIFTNSGRYLTDSVESETTPVHWRIMELQYKSTEPVEIVLELFPIVIWTKCEPQIDSFFNDYCLGPGIPIETRTEVVKSKLRLQIDECSTA